MAVYPLRFFFSVKQSRYPNFSFLFSPFSTLTTSINSNQINSHPNTNPNPNPNPNADESQILNQLSTLLPIRRTTIPNLYSPNSISSSIGNQTVINKCSPDGFLPIEDKLRGVFIQKLNGKASIENALSSALGDGEVNVEVVSRVLDRGNLGGEAMIMFFDWVVKQPGVGRDVGVYNVVLKALGRRKFFDFMVGKFREMSNEGVCPSCDTLMIVMDSFVRCRRLSKALEVFRDLEVFGMKCDTEAFNVLLRCLCKRSHVGIANSLLHSMKGKVVFDCVSYNVVIAGWARLGKVGEMERCLKEMVDDGFSANCRTYSSVIECLGRAGQVEDAVKIFNSMEDEYCRPDVRVYNAMIANFVSAGDFGECMTYYKDMLSNDCAPDVDTYRTIIAGLIKSRKVADALEMFDKMLRHGLTPTTGVITSFIEPLCSFGPPHAAMMLYKSARKYGCKVSVTAYKLLFMRLSRFGKCAMLLKLWNEMQECGHSSDMDVYEYVVNGLCNNGQLDTAVFVMEEALRKGFCPTRLMYSKLNNKLLASNKSEIAYKLFLKIRRARASENARKYWRANGWHF
ncbi:putative pentatricopeptide repeat-containing protein At5g43820 [Silene latifolia]|uniref:putative pentatricopeptide repeat-containing protein At5g43820 n=1 Tax=Silene latifolia TaxID=37657 RepID=UPI003D777F89